MSTCVRDGEVAQVVESLPSKFVTWSSNPSMTKTIKVKKPVSKKVIRNAELTG
jgi:hypothetical protein